MTAWNWLEPEEGYSPFQDIYDASLDFWLRYLKDYDRAKKAALEALSEDLEQQRVFVIYDYPINQQKHRIRFQIRNHITKPFPSFLNIRYLHPAIDPDKDNTTIWLISFTKKRWHNRRVFPNLIPDINRVIKYIL